jgi:hypothetical protein
MLRGMTIDHPERMSGSWEVKGEDAIYGLHIQLTTKAPAPGDSGNGDHSLNPCVGLTEREHLFAVGDFYNL